ncbi:954_t:CDS:2, partial [Scutellospora calospora]
MSNQQTKTCVGCHSIRNKITETVYNSLVSLNNTNEFYESENKGLNITFHVELSSLYNTILENNESQKENIEFEIGHHIASLVSDGDAKHPESNKQRDTLPFLERYDCKGIINIEILSNLDIVKVKYSHEILHPRPRHVSTTSKIKKFIQDKVDFNVPEIWRQIQVNHINGYKNFSIQQAYYWWSIESHKIYFRDSNPLLSAKRLLEEYNQEIIVDNLDSSTPTLGFLTLLFGRLFNNKFDAIAIDATYGTNNLGCELYSLLGIIDGAGFPLSYLFVSAGKNHNMTYILFQWMQAIKEKGLQSFSFILTDKDYSEINAAQAVWPEAHLQLCVWHVQRAIKQQLASTKTSTYYSYNLRHAHQELIKLVEDHSKRHMLLPKLDGTFITNADEIWKECV